MKAERPRFRIEEAIRGARIAIAGLPDAAGIDDQPTSPQLQRLLPIGRQHPRLRRALVPLEDHWNVSVSRQRHAEVVESKTFARRVCVQKIFPNGLTHAGMDQDKILYLLANGKAGQKSLVLSSELVPRPQKGVSRVGVEDVRVGASQDAQS